MPIIERALCQYEYRLNYRENVKIKKQKINFQKMFLNLQRIPATLAEVHCTCATKPMFVGGRQVVCEPLRYHVRVLLFDAEYVFVLGCKTEGIVTQTLFKINLKNNPLCIIHLILLSIL